MNHEIFNNYLNLKLLIWKRHFIKVKKPPLWDDFCCFEHIYLFCVYCNVNLIGRLN